jgi:hypothetical protein
MYLSPLKSTGSYIYISFNSILYLTHSSTPTRFFRNRGLRMYCIVNLRITVCFEPNWFWRKENFLSTRSWKICASKCVILFMCLSCQGDKNTSNVCQLSSIMFHLV